MQQQKDVLPKFGLAQWAYAGLFLIVALSCGFDPLFGQKVTEANGNLFLTEASGLTKQLTNQGKDYDPSLSPDGTMIVFARKNKRGSGPKWSNAEFDDDGEPDLGH